MRIDGGRLLSMDNKLKQIEVLNSVVKSKGADIDKFNVPSLVGKREIDRMQKVLLETKGMHPQDRYLRFLREDILVNEHTKDIYYEVLENLHPMGKKHAYKQIRKDFETKIAGYQNAEEREGYLRDVLPKLPADMLPDMERFFNVNADLINAKQKQANRVVQYLEFGNLLNRKFSFVSLDPNKSLESHVQDLLKAYGLGFDKDIKYVDGTATIPGPEGTRQPAYLVPSNKNIEDEFIMQMDLAPIIRTHLKPILDSARQKTAESEHEATESMFYNLNKLPQDIQTNVLIDYAMAQKADTVSIVNQGIESIIDREIKEGAIHTINNIVISMGIHKDRIKTTIAERLTDVQRR